MVELCRRDFKTHFSQINAPTEYYVFKDPIPHSSHEEEEEIGGERGGERGGDRRSRK